MGEMRIEGIWLYYNSMELGIWRLDQHSLDCVSSTQTSAFAQPGHFAIAELSSLGLLFQQRAVTAAYLCWRIREVIYIH